MEARAVELQVRPCGNGRELVVLELPGVLLQQVDSASGSGNRVDDGKSAALWLGRCPFLRVRLCKRSMFGSPGSEGVGWEPVSR